MQQQQQQQQSLVNMSPEKPVAYLLYPTIINIALPLIQYLWVVDYGVRTAAVDIGIHTPTYDIHEVHVCTQLM